MSKTYECRKALNVVDVRSGCARRVGTELALLLLRLESQVSDAGAVIEWETLDISTSHSTDAPIHLTFTARVAAVQW